MRGGQFDRAVYPPTGVSCTMADKANEEPTGGSGPRGLQGKCVNALLSKLGCILAFTLYLIPPTRAASASDVLPVALMTSGKPTDAPVANSAFAPGPQVTRAPDFVGTITLAQTPMQSDPAIAHPMQDARDARLFPAVTLEFFTMDGLLVPVQQGAMVRESASVKLPSFWQVIPQVGRVWKEAPDGKWSRAAFPL